ncbi:hypothetical protein HYALB_00003214 [Hymenoscyphus albidus]|uniref:C2H2-type domain-containing protein n=1 Tax=Hymenoscyphus albidus TaxID=595503 RepID=A0A9N9LYL4_9HELO|nr:hypothetical protein HYALB_00003214 [Hymenoscyphus albidus]
MDQQNRLQFSQFPSEPSWTGEYTEWQSEYQRGAWGTTGGEPMSTTNSNSTLYSQNSTYSDGTTATSMSLPYTLDSPSAENVQFSPGPGPGYSAAFGDMSLVESSSASAAYFPPQYQYPVQAAQPTPSSLGWDMTVMKVQDFYDFVVEKANEPYLQLRGQLQDHSKSPIVFLDKDSHESHKKRHPCLYPGRSCWKNGIQPVFARTADLERHYNVVHDGSSGEKFACDYLKCTRHNDTFTRKDHCRDHYKEYHKEDIGEYKGSKSAKDKSRWQAKQREWEAERKIDPYWWRCPKCLDRVKIEKSGWTCPGCKKECDGSRYEARMRLLNSSRTDDRSLGDSDPALQSDSTYHSYLHCSTCNDTGYVGSEMEGYSPCLYCQGTDNYTYDDARNANESYEEAPPSWSQRRYDYGCDDVTR